MKGDGYLLFSARNVSKLECFSCVRVHVFLIFGHGRRPIVADGTLGGIYWLFVTELFVKIVT